MTTIAEKDTVLIPRVQEADAKLILAIDESIAARCERWPMHPAFTVPQYKSGRFRDLASLERYRTRIARQDTQRLPVIDTIPLRSTPLPELPQRSLHLPADIRPEYATPTLSMACPEEPARQKRTMSFVTVVICLLTALVFLLLVLIVAGCAFRYGGGTLW